MGNTVSAAESVASVVTQQKFATATPPLPTNHKTTENPPPECPMHQKPTPSAAASDCPVRDDNSDINPYNNVCVIRCHSKQTMISMNFNQIILMQMPPANQNPAPGQPFPLPTDRQTSTIPKVTQEEAKEFWQYPSQQMFYNAMLRKGWQWREGDIKPSDMDAIIKIHNANNENAWQVVLMWEASHAKECGNPRLKSFGGKATSYSPRARFWNFFG